MKTFIEVCSGGGGLSQGLIKAGFTPILLNDNDINCCNTLKLNHPNINVFHGDMSDIPIQYAADVLVGGLACQSFSIAGERKGFDDDRGLLVYKFIELIEKINPKAFLIENVKGLTNHNKGETFKKFLEILPKNYRISYKILNSFDFLVPQKRERIFIIGIKDKDFIFPTPIEQKILLKNVLYQTPEIPNNDKCSKYPQNKIDLFKLIPQGGCWVNLPIELQKSYLGKSYFSTGGKRGILHRLSLNKPSLTILCSPSQKQTERCHPLYERPLTIRETARIQTFPDDYIFTGSITSQYKQIGNAVPVNLAFYVGKSLLDILNN